MPKDRTITAEDVANYVVCPEAWNLKRSSAESKKKREENRQAKEIRSQWQASQDLGVQLRKYAKLVFVLLFAIMFVVFLLEQHRFAKNAELSNKAEMIFAIPNEISLLILVLGLLTFFWDLFERKRSKVLEETGLDPSSKLLSIKGSKKVPNKEYYSESLGLYSKPDAILSLDNSIIPVIFKPLSQKIRDRHVVELLVSLRLVEETEKKRPPYGILILGKTGRQVKLQNTDEKQRWMLSLLEEMKSILNGVPALAKPSKFKCKNCDVRNICTHSAYHSSSTSQKN